MTRIPPKKRRQSILDRDLSCPQNHKTKATYVVILITLVFFVLGFSSGDNPLLGKWRCDVDRTMESLDTSGMSDMEKQFYLEYFKSIKYEVTEDEMITKTVTSTDRTHYEMSKQRDNKIYVYYPEEDENDIFTLLNEKTFKWSTDIKDTSITIFFVKQ